MKIIVSIVLMAGFLAGVLFAGRWALMPLLMPPQGLHSGTEADLIRDRYPDRLVDPSSLNLTDDEIGISWVFAETKARGLRALSGMVAYVCLAAGVMLWIWIKPEAGGYFRKRTRFLKTLSITFKYIKNGEWKMKRFAFITGIIASVLCLTAGIWILSRTGFSIGEGNDETVVVWLRFCIHIWFAIDFSENLYKMAVPFIPQEHVSAVSCNFARWNDKAEMQYENARHGVL